MSNQNNNSFHSSNSEAVTDRNWQEKNQRRVQLAIKKSEEGLSKQEQAEFDRLQQCVFAYLEAKHPGPDTNASQLDDLERRLKAHSRSSGGSRP